ncbi:MAG: hypothetical protein R3Y06_07680 [Faecalibacterium sp.]
MAKKKNTDALTEEVVAEESSSKKSSGAKTSNTSSTSSASTGSTTSSAGVTVSDVDTASSTAVDSASSSTAVQSDAGVSQSDYEVDTADLYETAAVETPATIEVQRDTTADAVSSIAEMENDTDETVQAGSTSSGTQSTDDGSTSTASVLDSIVASDAALASQSVSSKSDAESLLSDYYYTESDAVTAANEALATYLTTAPDEYTSSYQEQIDALLEQILTRDDFTYDFDADPLYQQYKNQYEHNALLAMQDTMAQAQTATGGYGSSYAVQAASGAYQSELNQLTSEMPELYALAYSLYSDEGTNMLDNLSALTDQEELAQTLYQDLVSNYYTGLEASTEAAENAYAKDYEQYEGSVSYLQELLDYYAGQEQQSFENDQTQLEYELAVKEYEESVRQWEEAQNQWWTSYYASQAASSSTSSTSNTSTTSSTSSTSNSVSSSTSNAVTLSDAAQDLKTTITQEMRNYAAMTGETVTSDDIAAQVENILLSYYRNDVITKEEANAIGASYGVSF